MEALIVLITITVALLAILILFRKLIRWFFGAKLLGGIFRFTAGVVDEARYGAKAKDVQRARADERIAAANKRIGKTD